MFILARELQISNESGQIFPDRPDLSVDLTDRPDLTVNQIRRLQYV